MLVMKKTSIKMKLFLGYAVLLISTLMCTILIAQNYADQVFYQTITADQFREQTLITNTLGQKIEHASDYIMSIALDNTIISTMKNHPGITSRSLEYNDVRRMMGAKVNSILGITQSLFEWDIITLNNDFLHVSGYDLLNNIEVALGEDYFSIANVQRDVVINGPFFVESPLANGNRVPVFVMSKQIVDLLSLEALGYIAFFITEESIASVFEENIPEQVQPDYYLLSDTNEILVSSQKQLIGHDFTCSLGFSKKEIESLFQNGTILQGMGQKAAYYTVTAMQQNNWNVVYVTSMEELMLNRNLSRIIVFLIGIVACLLALAIGGILAVKVTRPIVKLSKMMSTYFSVDTTKSINFISRDEIENLHTGFNLMVRDAQCLMQQIHDEQEEKSNYRFQLIQAQVKPHFLYNALETIKSLLDLEMYGVAGDAIIAISEFYRMSLNVGSDIISVADEIELSERYMYIQKLRHTEYLDYVFEVCASLEYYMIPKMTIQPLLENAIDHGIKMKQEYGRIRLIVTDQGDSLVLTIEDNGVGMDAGELMRIRESLKVEDKRNAASFGLYSINRRIKLLFGTNYGLDMDSEQGRYTRITVTIPKVLMKRFR